MSQTLTISDDLCSRLQTTARIRGSTTVEPWKRSDEHVSNIARKALQPAHQEIVGMGKAAIPLLLTELRNDLVLGPERDHGSEPGAFPKCRQAARDGGSLMLSETPGNRS